MFSMEPASYYPASAQNLEVAPTFVDSLWTPGQGHVELRYVDGASEEYTTSGPIGGTGS